MKKLTVLFAAAAMFAFVGCNKQENTTYVADQNGNVTLMMSGENWQNTTKQTYVEEYNRIAFNIGDQVYINGVLADLTPCDVNGATNDADNNAIDNSFYGMMTVNGNVLTGDDYVLYPAEIFTAGTAADMSDYTVTLDAQPLFIPQAGNTLLGGGFPAWPTAAKLSGNQFLLKNAVAILTPSIKYGAPFIMALKNQANSPIANEDVINDFPELYIEEIELVSTDQILAGTGHIANIATNPTLVMDNGTYQVNINADDFQVLPSSNGETYLGNITMAPIPAGKHLNMKVKFWLYFPGSDAEYHFVYNGTNVEITAEGQGSVVRSGRSTLCANLYSAANVSKVTPVVE